MFSCWHQCRPLGHLLLSIFLHYTAVCLVVPALTDITMSALCPGDDECSQAIYLTGLQQARKSYPACSGLSNGVCQRLTSIVRNMKLAVMAISGIGTMLVTPILGGLSDKYGRKALLMVPMTISIVPLVAAVLAYSRSKPYVYTYFVLKTLAAVVSEGGMHCISLAYVSDYVKGTLPSQAIKLFCSIADNIPEHSRAPAFGLLTGIMSSAFVVGITFARFLPEFVIFQVATVLAAFSAVYLRIFLVEPKFRSSCLLGRKPVCQSKSSSFWSRRMLIFRTSSIQDTAQLFKRRLFKPEEIRSHPSLQDIGQLFSKSLYALMRVHGLESKAQWALDFAQVGHLGIDRVYANISSYKMLTHQPLQRLVRHMNGQPQGPILENLEWIEDTRRNHIGKTNIALKLPLGLHSLQRFGFPHSRQLLKALRNNWKRNEFRGKKERLRECKEGKGKPSSFNSSIYRLLTI
eukprot:Gb_07254 [translate_table: standard]